MAFEIPQTTFATAHDRFLPGMVDRISEYATEKASRYLDVDMTPGLIVIKRTASADRERVRLPTAAGDITSALIEGALVMDQLQTPTYAYKSTTFQSVLRRGAIWIPVAVADVSGTAANSKTLFVVHSGASAGMVSGAAGAGPDATAFPAGTFEVLEGGVVGSCALIRLTLP